MSFTDHKSTKYRPAIIATVAALHAGAFYAIVTGLGVKYVEQITNIPLGYNIPDEPVPPPPPPPETKRKKTDEPPLQTQKQTDNPNLGNTTIDLPVPGPTPPFDGPIEITLPEPLPPVPSFKAKNPQARGNPGLWATTNDYPTRDIRQGNEGTARFLLDIDARGRVMNCTITRSSGHPGLDQATCDNVTRRAKFEPATDASGAKIAGTYSGSIKWIIPD